MNFRRFNDAELDRLSDEELVAYIVKARRAGEVDAAVEAAQVLAYRYERQIRGFMGNQLGSKGPVVVEQVAELTIFDAIRSAAGFEGTTDLEFKGWIFKIARRRIADYHRKKRVDEVPLEVDWGEGSEERKLGPGDASAATADPLDAVERASVFTQAWNELEQDSHKMVICLVRFYDLPHKEIADQVNRHFGDQLDDPMTEQNVNKINSRFGKRLKELLKDDGDD